MLIFTESILKLSMMIVQIKYGWSFLFKCVKFYIQIINFKLYLIHYFIFVLFKSSSNATTCRLCPLMDLLNCHQIYMWNFIYTWYLSHRVCWYKVTSPPSAARSTCHVSSDVDEVLKLFFRVDAIGGIGLVQVIFMQSRGDQVLDPSRQWRRRTGLLRGKAQS